MKKSIRVIALASLIGLALAVGNASATMYGFYNITDNIPANAATGADQLFVDVTKGTANEVLFTFNNIGPEASSITQIYFQDDVPLLTFKTLIEETGVDFDLSKDKNPGLPGGKENSIYEFVVTGAYDAQSPVQRSGINPGETLTIVFTTASTYTFSDIIAALDQETFRVGIHVQGFADGGSESFINNPVPEPGTMLLLGAGFLGLAIYGKRRKNS